MTPLETGYRDGSDPDRPTEQRPPVLHAGFLGRSGPGPGVGRDRPARAGPGQLVRDRSCREGRAWAIIKYSQAKPTIRLARLQNNCCFDTMRHILSVLR